MCRNLRPLFLLLICGLCAILAGASDAAILTDLPPTLRADVLLWYEAGTGVSADGFGVHTWTNIEGSPGRDAAQATDNRKPQWLPSVAAINNRPAVSFDGVNNGTADGLDTTTTALMENRPQFEVFLVANIASTQNDYARVLSEETSGAGGRVYNLGVDAGTPRRLRSVMDTTGGVTNEIEPTTSLGSYRVYNQRLEIAGGGTHLMDVDGTNATSISSRGVTSVTGNSVFRLGGAASNPAFNNDFAAVDVAEVLVFSRTLTPGERNALGYALETKYGLSTAYVDPGPAPKEANPERTILVDFGKVALTSDPNGAERWNDVTSVSANTTVKSNLIDVDGQATGADLFIGAITSSGSPTLGIGGWDETSPTTTGYPLSATRDGMVAFDNGSAGNVRGTIELRNLDDNMLYNLTMYASASGARDFTAWEIGGATKQLSPTTNDPQNDTVIFTHVPTDGNGVISIEWFGLNDPAFGKAGTGRDIIWSSLEITQLLPVPEPSTLALAALGLLGLALCGRRRKGQ
jgi:hypothetical protein